jgi:hypothetical protein
MTLNFLQSTKHVKANNSDLQYKSYVIHPHVYAHNEEHVSHSLFYQNTNLPYKWYALFLQTRPWWLSEGSMNIILVL